MTPLRQKMIRELELQRKSSRTVEAYVYAVQELATHFRRSPERVSVEEVRKPSIHANHLIHEDMASLPQVITDSSGSRQQRGDRQIRAGGEVDPLAILWDAADAQLPIHRTDPADPDLENTLATVRFSIGTDRVEWSVYDDRKRLTGFANCRVLVPAAA